jgi:hypothetical protein
LKHPGVTFYVWDKLDLTDVFLLRIAELIKESSKKLLCLALGVINDIRLMIINKP